MHRQDAEGDFFREIAEQGHYAGRTRPTATRQGLYIVGIDAQLLSSVNSTRAQDVMGIMGRALAKWDRVDHSKMKSFVGEFKPDSKYHLDFPKGGLILQQTMRDLPRTSQYRQETWRHNFDHVWLTQREAASFLPSKNEVGHSFRIPDTVVKRWAQFHTVDQVKGEADAWKVSDIQKAELRGEVKSIEGNRLQVKLTGQTRSEKAPNGEVNPYSGSRISAPRGVDLKVRGWLEYDLKQRKFLRFDLLAVGDRWGTATYNFRQNDMGPEPIGFSFKLLETKPENMTLPKFGHWNYFANQ